MTYLLDTCLISELVGNLEQQGRPLPALDSLIAAIALQNSLSLVTRNENDFVGTGVLLVNPWTSSQSLANSSSDSLSPFDFAQGSAHPLTQQLLQEIREAML